MRPQLTAPSTYPSLLLSVLLLATTALVFVAGDATLTQHYISFQSKQPLLLRSGETSYSSLQAPEDVLLSLQGAERIEEISVTINNINHPNPQRLSFLLEGPHGVYSTLMFSCVSTCDRRQTFSITFNEEAPNSIQDVKYLCSLSHETLTSFTVRTGICDGTSAGSRLLFPATTYQPANGFVSLVVFEGAPIAGEWKLWVADTTEASAGEGVGSIGSWSIEALFVVHQEGAPIMFDEAEPIDIHETASADELASPSSSIGPGLPPSPEPVLTIESMTPEQIEREKARQIREEILDEISMLHSVRATNGSSGLVVPGDTSVGYYDTSKPAVTFYSYKGGQVQADTGYLFALSTVAELDAAKNVLRSYNFPTSGYTITNPSAEVTVYTITFNGALFTFTFTYYATITVVSFAGSSFATYGDSTVLNLKIDDWPFLASGQYLQISFTLNALQGAFEAPDVAPVPGSSLTEVIYVNTAGFTARYTILNLALIDGVSTNNVDISVPSTTAFITLPKGSSIEFDPDFSLTVTTKDSDGGSNDDWVIAVGVVVPVAFIVVLLVILVGSVFLFVGRKRLRSAISRSSSSSSSKTIRFDADDDL